MYQPGCQDGQLALMLELLLMVVESMHRRKPASSLMDTVGIKLTKVSGTAMKRGSVLTMPCSSNSDQG